METYANLYNSINHQVNSGLVYDLIMSSGKEGNSKDGRPYRVFEFKLVKGHGAIEEKIFSVTQQDLWTPICLVTYDPQIGVPRLSYLLTNESHTSQIKILHNNKNNYRTNRNGQILKIDSRYQLGSGSYNVWFTNLI